VRYEVDMRLVRRGKLAPLRLPTAPCLPTALASIWPGIWASDSAPPRF